MLTRKNSEFFHWSMEMLLRHKIGVHLLPRKFISDEEGNRWGGEFDEESRTLSVATGIAHKKWFPVYIHEFAHFRQYQAQTKLWVASNDHIEPVFDSIADGGGKCTKRDVTAVIRMELEAERMVLDMIQEHDLNINREEYLQGTNAYMLYYAVCVYKFGKWPKKSLYRDNTFLKMLPCDKIMPLTWYFKPPTKILKHITSNLKE